MAKHPFDRWSERLFCCLPVFGFPWLPQSRRVLTGVLLDGTKRQLDWHCISQIIHAVSRRVCVNLRIATEHLNIRERVCGTGKRCRTTSIVVAICDYTLLGSRARE